MVVKCVNNNDYPILEKGKKYNAYRCVIHGWHSDVYLEGFKHERFNSVIFDESFQKEFRKAIKFFDKNPHEYDYNIFERDY